MRLRYIIIVVWMIFCLIDPLFAKTNQTHSKHKRHARVHHRKSNYQSTAKAISVSPTPKIPVTYGDGQLASQLTAAINSVGGASTIAVYVKSMKSGDTLYSRNISQPLVPASTMKVLTAEAALLFLKSDYRFPTHLLTDAKSVKNGVLQGNLYIVLNGDPTLTFNDVLELMNNLQTQQIQAVSGNVYIDNTAYDQRFYGPGWVYKDKSYCYGAPISASIINHNCLPFKIALPKEGRNNRVGSAGRNRQPNCSLHLSSSLNGGFEIGGCMPGGKTEWIGSYVVTDVPEYNRALFKGVLNQLGVRVYGTVTFGTAPANLSMVGLHASKPLSELLTEMLKKSDNIIAGALFKKLGQLYTHRPGSWENGSFAVSQILSKRAGVDVTGLRILDGSGLSPDNLAKPSQMMQVLDFAFHHEIANDFISALPIAGVDGTLKHRMKNIIRKVRAKTGTISGVVSLAGYATAATGEPLAFVIMVNGNKGMTWRYKEMEDRIVTALARFKR